MYNIVIDLVCDGTNKQCMLHVPSLPSVAHKAGITKHIYRCRYIDKNNIIMKGEYNNYG